MIMLQWAFDIVLGLTLMWLAWRALASENLFKGIVLFIAFSLLMVLAWVRLDAPDIALTEAAIGAGLTGALLLAALAKLDANNADSQPLRESMVFIFNKQTLFKLLLVLLLSVLAAGLGYAILRLPPNAIGLSVWVAQNIEASGVNNPVTAVLLNFRAYDTLLEMAVLLLAVLSVWSLSVELEHSESTSGAVLDLLSRLLVPLLVLFSGYLLWAGTNAVGGAFQAGSVLAAAGVLWLLAGWRPGVKFTGLPLRFLLVLGLGMFVAVAVVLLLFGKHFLEFPMPYASALILLIEAAAAVSIGVTLAALFLGHRPQPGRSSVSREKSGVRK